MTMLLCTLSGKDRPGVTSALFKALSGNGVTVLDAEQITIRGQLTLAVLVELPGDCAVDDIEPTLRASASELDLDCEIDTTIVHTVRTGPKSLVTLWGQPLMPEAVQALADVVQSTGGNITRMRRVAHYPVVALEWEIAHSDPDELRALLAQAAVAHQVDVAVQRAGLERRGAGLVVMDVDSTLIQDEVIELLAAHCDCHAEVQAVTERAMRGELDFAQSLHARVALLEGLPATVLADVRREVRLTPGARTLCRTLKRLGYRIGVVSGGFSEVVGPLAEELGIDEHRANQLEVANGLLTGRVIGPVIDRKAKAAALDEWADKHGVPLSRTVAIGDGANDLDMLARAGLGIAFNAKPIVREAADTAVNVPYLDTVLYLLGITREEVEEADHALD